MLKKKEEKKSTLEDLVSELGDKPSHRTSDEVAYALKVLRDAAKLGQIRNINGNYSGNDVCFGLVASKEELNRYFQADLHAVYSGFPISYYSRIKYGSALDELILLDASDLVKEKVETLKSQISQAQHDQKLKVEEIEKLAKELSELVSNE